jgi:hypothetical protein
LFEETGFGREKKPFEREKKGGGGGGGRGVGGTAVMEREVPRSCRAASRTCGVGEGGEELNLGFDEAAAFEHKNTTAIFIVRHTHTRALWV